MPSTSEQTTEIKKHYRCIMRAGNKTFGLLKLFIVLLVLSGYISFAFAYEATDLQWGQGVSKRLIRGETITYNDYTVKVISFPNAVESDRYTGSPVEPVQAFVGLNVSQNGTFVGTAVLGLQDSYITPDGELKVAATGLPASSAPEWLLESYSPWAVIELSPRGKPALDVTLDTDKNDYASADDTEIISYVTLTNRGSADAFSVDLIIDTPLQAKTGLLKYYYPKIKNGESITETITFTLPVSAKDMVYSIAANVSAKDVKDLPYSIKPSKNISVVLDPEWSMSLRKTTLEKIYLTDSSLVSLTLKNNGKLDIKNVSIVDSVPKGFKLVSNVSLRWVTDIPAGGEWNFRYLVAPEVPNSRGVVFPVATAEFKVKKELYGIRSNQPKIIVHGPFVSLEKRTSVPEIKPGDTVEVTVNAKNTGSTPTRIFIKDQLPEGAALISGTTSFEEFLEAGKEVSFSYTIKIDLEGVVNLPPAIAQYFKLGNKGGKISTESTGVQITVKLPEEITRTAETPLPTPPLPEETPAPIAPPNDTSRPDPNVPDAPGSQRSLEQPVNVDTLLSLILGCDGTQNINPSETCRYFEQDR